MRRALAGFLALGAVSAEGDEARSLQACPALEKSEYTSEPSPFGWPLTPNDWSFADSSQWPQKYMLCGGERQSPIDISLASVTCHVDKRGEDGALKHVANYLPGTLPPRVKVNRYMRTVMVEGSFGSLTLGDPTGANGSNVVEFEATQVHLTAGSLHSVNGKFYDAEMLIFHKPKSDKNMLKVGVIVSVLFSLGGASSIFSEMGFSSDGKKPEAGSWNAPHYIDLPAAVQDALEGASYQYNGSVPVPPCSENVKYIVLGKVQQVSSTQVKALQDVLSCYAGGFAQRSPFPNPYKESCRAITKNSIEVGGNHSYATCQTTKTSNRSAVCWEAGMTQEMKAECVASPIDSVPSMASSDGEGVPSFNFKPINHVRVSGGDYTLDAEPMQAGVPGPVGNFGSIMVHGRNFLVVKISVKAISSHTYGGVHHAGEIQIECVMFGDALNTSSLLPQGGPSGGETPAAAAAGHRRLAAGDGRVVPDAVHRLILSVPLALGAASQILREIGLPLEGYRSSVKDHASYDMQNTVNLGAGIKQAMDGPWLWYKGGLTKPGCAKWGVRWLLFQTPIEASIAQLNFLTLQVSGMDSTRCFGHELTSAAYKAQVFSMALPKFAVDGNSTCGANETWNYDNVNCWSQTFPTCSEGKRQSPINIIPSEVTKVGKANFLHKTGWRPVSGLHITNNGYNLQVTNQQLGYIEMVGSDGFPEFFKAAQFHVNMPSEHMINGRQFAAELHIVHERQESVSQEKNSQDAFPLLVTAFFFDIGEDESNFLKQLYLGQSTIANNSYKTAKEPIDLMRSLGPALDGNFYHYNGSFTTPDCHEQIKWFVFDHVFSMSFAQWKTYTAVFPAPNDNRPVQPVHNRTIAKNSFEDGTPVHYDFFLARHLGRNRFKPGEGYIIIPICVSLAVMSIVMMATFVRESGKKIESAGGLADTIGRGTYNRM